jgi:hypothetical protein
MPHYRAITINNTIAESEKKKTPSVKLQFYTQFEHSLPSVSIMKKFSMDLWLSDKCFDRTMEVLNNVFGWQGDDVSELNYRNDLLAGTEVDLVTGIEEYKTPEGEVKRFEKVKFVNNPNNAYAKQLEEEVLSPIASALRGKVIAYRQKNAGKPAPEIKRSVVPTSVPAPLNDINDMAAEIGESRTTEELPF